jgi:hypothetical protein
MVAMMAELGGVALRHINSPFFDDVPGGLSATTSAHGTYGFEALFGLTGVVTLPFGNSMRRMMQAALLIQSALPAHRRCAQQGTQQRAHGDVCSVGVLAADLLTGNDGIQQIGLGAVRERGLSRCESLFSPPHSIGKKAAAAAFFGSVYGKHPKTTSKYWADVVYCSDGTAKK